jgi:hypothetical protein
VVEVADLAPDEPEPVEEPVMEVADLAPDEPETVEEPVMEVADLAPDEPETVEEPVMEVADLAPDALPSASDLLFDEVYDEPMVTRTMAELFASQGLVDRALEVFRQLLQVTPGDAGLRQRVAELSARWEGSEVPEAEAQAKGSAAPPATDYSSAVVVQEDDDLSGHAWDADAQADHHDVDTPFAWTHQEPDETSAAGPPISKYFSRMLRWEPGRSDSRESLDAEADSSGGEDRKRWLNREDA